MGDRANVELRSAEGSMYLYSHWGGTDLPGAVQKVLLTPRAKAREHDDQYLARIIVTGIVFDAGDSESETGWGLGVVPGDGRDRVLVVDLDKLRVGVRNADVDGDPEPERWWSFDDFRAMRQPTWRMLTPDSVEV